MSLYKSDKELELLPTLQKIDSLGEDVKLLIKKLERIETDLKEIRKEILDNPVEKAYTLSHNAGGDVYTESKK